MAFFKFRKAAGEPSAPAPAPESVDALRKRARYRLAGAAMLVLAGVVGFPLLFDNQPRPIAVDIPIDIPDRAKVKPMSSGPVAESSKTTEPAAAAATASTATTAATPVAARPVAVAPNAADGQKEEVILSTSKPATAAPAAKADSKAEPKTDTKTDAKTVAKASEKPADKAPEKPAATGRFIVQFGAFTESARAQEARFKVEKTGLKTYAQVADTPDGKKYRVRVGPFDKRSDAEKAAEKIKKLGLPAAILGL